MSTPRRSGRLQKREEGKVKREGRLRTRREHQLSKGGSNGGSDSSGSDSEEERLMITPTQTSAKKRVNDFVKVHNRYNCDDDIDWYEEDFIDDSEVRTPRRQPNQRKGEKCRRKRVLSLSGSEGEDDEGGISGKTLVKRKQLVESSSDDGGPAKGEKEKEEGEEEEEEGNLVRKQKRRRHNTICSDDSSEDDNASGPKPQSARKRRCKQLESDEEEADSSQRRSKRVRQLRELKDREIESKLKCLRADRGRIKEKHGVVAQRETEEDVAIAGGEEEREAEEEADPAGRLQQVLFPELISSDEDSDDSDWIVGDLDDYSEVEKAFCHIEDQSEEGRSWKDELSVAHLLPPIRGPVCVEQWSGEVTADVASSLSDEGLLPLVCAASCAHTSSFSSLLPLTPMAELQEFLSSAGITLLHLIIEAPLSRTDSNQTEGVVASDVDSLACLEAFRNQNRSVFDQQVCQSLNGRPSLLKMAVWHCRPKCVGFFLSIVDFSPFSVEEDLFEGDNLPHPPSLLHLAVLSEAREKEGEGREEVLKHLLPTLTPELEVEDGEGYTPLMQASSVGDVSALTLLLNHGADINVRDQRGTSPLHVAAASGHVDCVNALTSHGHPVDCRDGEGWPPLLYAQFAGHHDCVLALMTAKPSQLSVLSDLLKKTDRGSGDDRMKNIKVVRSLLLSLANHEAYFSLFNEFIASNLSVLQDEGFDFMKHCMGLLSFENKQSWLREKLSRLRERARELASTSNLEQLTLWDISREDILETVRERLGDLTAVQCWMEPLNVKFIGEPGICTGPRREFWSLFSSCLASGKHNLFVTCDNEQLSLQPCDVFTKYSSALSPSALSEHQKLLHLCGTLLAYALCHGDTVDVNLTKPLLKQLLDSPLSHPSDLEYADREFHHSLTLWLDDESVCDLELTFTCTLVSPWDNQSVEVPIVAGGRSQCVTMENKRDYIMEMSRFKLEGCIWKELEPFRAGFWKEMITRNELTNLFAVDTPRSRVVPRRWLQVFTPDQLSLLLSGVPTIDVDDWRKHTVYRGFTSSSPEVHWLWRLIGSLKEEERALLLQFATGSPRTPAGGFSNLRGLCGPTPFTVSIMPGQDKIPQASTCFNDLKLSCYSCEQELRDKTLIAIRYGCEGFAFS